MSPGDEIQTDEYTTNNDVGIVNSNDHNTYSDEGNSSLNSSRQSLCTDVAPLEHPLEIPSGVVVQDSTHVQIGTRLEYNAPVTINQYVTGLGSTSHELANTALKAPYQGLDEDHGEDIITKSTESVPTVDKSGAIKCRWSLWTICSLLVVTVLLVLGIGVIVLITRPSQTLTTPTSSESSDTSPGSNSSNNNTHTSVDPDSINTTLSSTDRRIISKHDWGGYPTLLERPHWVLEHPTPYVLITHTGGNTCFNTNTCAMECRNIQNENVGGQYEMADISSNFLVGGDGNVYEGRGWDLTNPFRGFAYLKRHNIAVAFMGNFVFEKPTSIQLKSALALLDLGIKLGKLDPSYKLLAHNETTPTVSPGANVYVNIKSWTHFWIPT